MDASTPRLAGRQLRWICGILRSPLTGPPLARALSRRIIDKPLEMLDMAAEGEPPAMYMPRRWVAK